MSTFKQSYLLVMKSGKIVKWTGYGKDFEEGKRLATYHAINQTGEQVWDMCARPVK